MRILLTLVIILMGTNIALAKPFKVENSNGQLVRCGDWKNTPNAMGIRGCPQLGDYLESSPIPEPTPTPFIPTEPTIVPTVLPTGQPVTCEYRFVETAEGLMLDKVYPPGITTHTCAYLPKVNKPFIEVNSVNRSIALCNVFKVYMRSPSGVQYESTGVQPGMPIQPEIGTWQVDVTLSTESLCATNKALLITIRTKG